MKNEPSARNLILWFDPRHRTVSTWGFILNRVTALGLTLYLFIHLVALGNLARGPEAYDAFLEFAHQPVIKAGEMLVIAAGLIHGLNGLRIALNSFGIAARWQRQIFLALMVIAAAGIVFFGYKLFIDS